MLNIGNFAWARIEKASKKKRRTNYKPQCQIVVDWKRKKKLMPK